MAKICWTMKDNFNVQRKALKDKSKETVPDVPKLLPSTNVAKWNYLINVHAYQFLGIVNQTFHTSFRRMWRFHQWHIPCCWISVIHLRPSQSRLRWRHVSHTIICCSKMIILCSMESRRKPFAGLSMKLPSSLFRVRMVEVGLTNNYWPSTPVDTSLLWSFGMQSRTSTQ